MDGSSVAIHNILNKITQTTTLLSESILDKLNKIIYYCLISYSAGVFKYISSGVIYPADYNSGQIKLPRKQSSIARLHFRLQLENSQDLFLSPIPLNRYKAR